MLIARLRISKLPRQDFIFVDFIYIFTLVFHLIVFNYRHLAKHRQLFDYLRVGTVLASNKNFYNI